MNAGIDFEGDDTEDSTSENVAELLELQLSEIEMLSSMFPNKGEFVIDDPAGIKNVQEFLKGSIKYEYLHSRLGFTIHVSPEGTKLSVELVCNFPHDYPNVSPTVFTRCPLMSRENHKRLQEDLHQYIQSLDRGEICMYSVVEWIQEHLQNYTQEEDTQSPVETKQKREEDGTLTRLWIYSHHIYSKFKRRDIIDWAGELKLTGFSLPGKPGIICAEGYSRNVDEYWHRLRNLNWKRLCVKEKEDKEIGDDDISKHRKFPDFEEKVFGVRGGKGREYHMDFGQLSEFLSEHGCGHIFSIYFGVDGKGGGATDS
ncbi:hypothetical protein FSP39_025469 [Pinctada imbricata]|uniref:RWD domain-containing protein n=1 Tax=Pinctada imbricata TaxID=66713 RepID=A0AA88YFX0_PINIB|nr:hypothetical protein FSP39_025469 [Pinctada imbricata]